VKRRPFDVLAAVSFALCIVALTLWTISFFLGFGVEYNWHAPTASGWVWRSVYLQATTGVFCFVDVSGKPPSWQPSYGPRIYRFAPIVTGFYIRNNLRPSITDNSSSAGTMNGIAMPPYLISRFVGVPGWFAVIATAFLPSLWIIRYRRRTRRTLGQCSVCGYDLRATPNRCPECGNVPSQVAVSNSA